MSKTSLFLRSPSESSFLIRLLRKVGIDRAIGFTLIGRSWAAFAGLVNLILLTRLLSPIQQGFYYTFSSVINLTVFFELGLGYVLVQFASHERAGLEWSAQGTLEGDENAKMRMSSLLRMSLVWYGILGILVIATLLPAGLAFFGAYAPHGVSVAWKLPWVGVVLVTGIALMIGPVYFILEGSGKIAEIVAVGAVQGVVASVVCWTALWLHGGLMAAPLGNAVALLYGMGWLFLKKRGAIWDLLTYAAHMGHAKLAPISWRKEIWPFQWKIAVSGISGYFISQLFNPLLFRAHGAAAAGRMGLCITVMTAIGTIAIGWVSTKSASFGTLIAKRDFEELDRLFFPCLWQSLIVVVVGGACFWSAAVYLHQIHHRLSLRLLDSLPLGLLIATAILNHVISAEGMYLRSHKQEPLLWLSVAGALCISVLSFFLVGPFGAVGLMSGYFLTTLVLGLGCVTWVFVRKRREWHSDLPLPPSAELKEVDIS